MTSILSELGRKYGTDKVDHGYCDVYHQAFEKKRQEVTAVMEIGVFFGASIRMWKDYFPNAVIHGVDHFSNSWKLSTELL